MKRIFTILTAILLIASVLLPQQVNAQSPEKMSYQAVIRNSSGQLISNQSVGMQISILQGSAGGASVYTETQTPGTNANGLVSIEIGDGTVVSGDFSTIEWGNGTYFIKTETDPAGGTNYSITDTRQLLSVPYALHAKTAGGISESDPIYSVSEAANITAIDISNLGNLSGTNTGNQNISGIAANTQAIKDTASQIRADIPDVSGFLISEVDGSVTNEIEMPGNAVSGDMSYYDGSSWTKISAPDSNDMMLTYCSGIPMWTSNGVCPLPAVGDYRDGGVVFWLDPADNKHGLVCAIYDQSTGIQWYNGSYTTTGATGIAIGTGQVNTSAIVSSQGAGSYAAQLCDDLNLNDYSDWFLPSKDELNEMYLNKSSIDATATANGGVVFTTNLYWSSTEYNNNYAWKQVFSIGGQNNYRKSTTDRVRAVRAF